MALPTLTLTAVMHADLPQARFFAVREHRHRRPTDAERMITTARNVCVASHRWPTANFGPWLQAGSRKRPPLVPGHACGPFLYFCGSGRGEIDLPRLVRKVAPGARCRFIFPLMSPTPGRLKRW